MKPGIPEWASNSLWAGGGYAAQATKNPPTSGKRDEGWYPDLTVSAQELNYLMHELGIRAAGLASMRLLNWSEIYTTGAWAAVVGGPMAGIFDPVTGTDVVADFTAAFAFEDLISIGGLTWVAGPGGAVSGSSIGIAIDHLGNIGVVNGVLCPPGILGVFVSPTPIGAWVPWPGGAAPAGRWMVIEHDQIGRWVIGDVAGAMLTSLGPLAAFGAMAAAPGFGTQITCLKHTHHPAGKLWPQDPGNQYWVVLSTTQKSRSADGTNWTAAAAHGLGGVPFDMGYSAFGAKWITTVVNAGVLSLMYSLDNGVNWNAQTAPATALGAIQDAKIVSDGYGDWMIALTDGAEVEAWSSWDNGVTWHLVALPDPTFMTGGGPYPANIALWYGGGRFFLFTKNVGAGVCCAFASLRADE